MVKRTLEDNQYTCEKHREYNILFALVRQIEQKLRQPDLSEEERQTLREKMTELETKMEL